MEIKHISFAFAVAIAVCGAMLAGYAGNNTAQQERALRAKQVSQAIFPKGSVEINGQCIDVKVANTAELRSFGLQFAKKAQPGMLLLWQVPGDYSVWMKYTEINLSAAFIGPDNTIVKITDLLPNSLKSVGAATPVIAILELPINDFERRGISAGDKISWRLKGEC